MIFRATLIALLLAVPSFAASTLTLGPEIDVGTSEPVVPEATYYRAAMATDGDETFVVHSSGAALFATRIDPTGRVLTPQPIVVLARTATEGAMPYTDPHVLWHRGHYLVFFVNETGNIAVLRATREGETVERVTLATRIEFRAQFDVATDGDEILLVTNDPKVVRLGSDLQPIGTVDLFQPPYFYDRARGVAYGGGRFAIVSSYRDRVVVQFLENGVLGAAVYLSEANIDEAGVVRVAWTGSQFVAAWTECSEDDVCLSVWAPLTASGTASGPIRAIGYSRISSTYVYRFDITLTAIDEDTVFFTWRDQDQKIAFGRRYRLSGAPVGDAVNFGTGPLAALRTPGGALAVFDSRRRLAWIESPASAPLPADVPLVPAVIAPAAESLGDAAASLHEVAVLRRSDPGTVVSILSHEGALLRTVPVAETYFAALASDGEQFYVLRNRWLGPVVFEALETATRVELSPYGWAAHLVWTGEEFLAVWQDQAGVMLLARLDRGGKLLGMPRVLDAREVLSFIARDGRVLLATYKNGISVTVLDAHGAPIGPAEELGRLNPYGGLALAMNGDTDAFAGVTSGYEDLVLGFRPRNGVFVLAPTTPEPPPPSRMPSYDRLAIAAANDGFIAAFSVYGQVLDTPHLALLNNHGLATRSIVLPPGTTGRQMFVEVAPDRLLYFYTRVLDDPAHAGLPRAFVRTVTIEEDTVLDTAGHRRR